MSDQINPYVQEYIIQPVLDNQTALDNKIGTLSDDESDNTLLGKIYILERHFHSESRTYPYLANGILLTGGTNAWTFGNYIEVVPVNTITSPFDIHYINASVTNVSDVFQVEFYSGLVGSEVNIGTVRIRRDQANSNSQQTIMLTPIIAANSRISARIASSSGGNDTMTISIMYHMY